MSLDPGDVDVDEIMQSLGGSGSDSGGDGGSGGGGDVEVSGGPNPGDVQVDIPADEDSGGGGSGGGSGSDPVPSGGSGGAGPGGQVDVDVPSDGGGADAGPQGPPTETGNIPGAPDGADAEPEGPGLDPGDAAGESNSGGTEPPGGQGPPGPSGQPDVDVPSGGDSQPPSELTGDVTDPRTYDERLDVEDRQFRKETTPIGDTRVRQQAQDLREQRARELSNQYGADVDPYELEARRRGDQLVVRAPRNVRKRLRLEEAAGGVAGASPSDFYVDEQTGEVRPTEDLLREEAASNVPGASPSDFTVEDGVVRPTEQYATEQAERSLEISEGITATGPRPGDVQVDQVDLQRGEDYVLEETDQGYQPRLTDEYIAQEAAAELGMPGFELGSEIDVDRGSVSEEEAAAAGAVAGAVDVVAPGMASAIDETFQAGEEYATVELTPQGKRMYVRTEAAQEGELAGRKIEDVGQIQFDERGNVTDVEPADTSLGERYEAAKGDLPKFPGSRQLAFVDALSQEAVQEGQEHVVDPLAEVGGDVMNLAQLGAPGAPAALVAEGEFQERAGTAFWDLTRPAEQEAAAPSVWEGAGEKIGTGAGGTAAALTVGLPHIGLEAGKLGAGALEYTAEEIDEEGVAAGVAGAAYTGAVVGGAAAEKTAETAAKHPYRAAGAVAGGYGIGRFLSPFRYGKADLGDTADTTYRGLVWDAPLTAGDARPVVGLTQEGSILSGPSVGVSLPRFARPDVEADAAAPGASPAGAMAPMDLDLRTIGRLEGGVDVDATAPSINWGTAKSVRPVRGTPDVDYEGPPMDANAEGFAPMGRLESYIARQNIDDPRLSTAMALNRGLGRRNPLLDRFDQARSRLAGEGSATEAIRQSRRIPDEAAEEVVQVLKEEDAMLGGSASQLAQIGRSRTPEDIDVYTPRPSETGERLKQTLDEYTERDIRMRSAGDLEIETDSGYAHLVDISHRDRPTGQIHWGARYNQPLYSDEGLEMLNIRSQLSAKVRGSTRLYGEDTIAPISYRAKDVFDTETVATALAERSRQSWNPWRRWQGRRAESDVERYHEEWGDVEVPGGRDEPARAFTDWDDLEETFAVTAMPEPEGQSLFRGGPLADLAGDTRGQATLVGGARRVDVDTEAPAAPVRTVDDTVEAGSAAGPRISEYGYYGGGSAGPTGPAAGYAAGGAAAETGGSYPPAAPEGASSGLAAPSSPSGGPAALGGDLGGYAAGPYEEAGGAPMGYELTGYDVGGGPATYGPFGAGVGDYGPPAVYGGDYGGPAYDVGGYDAPAYDMPGYGLPGLEPGYDPPGFDVPVPEGPPRQPWQDSDLPDREGDRRREYYPYEIPFENPIASGAAVFSSLFGGIGGGGR